MFFKFYATFLCWLLHISCLYLHSQNHCPQRYRQNKEQSCSISKMHMAAFNNKSHLCASGRGPQLWLWILHACSWPTHQSSQSAPLPSINSSTCSIKPQLFHRSLPDCCSQCIIDSYGFQIPSALVLFLHVFVSNHIFLMIRIIKPATSVPHAPPPAHLHSPASPPPLSIPRHTLDLRIHSPSSPSPCTFILNPLKPGRCLWVPHLDSKGLCFITDSFGWLGLLPVTIILKWTGIVYVYKTCKD